MIANYASGLFFAAALSSVACGCSGRRFAAPPEPAARLEIGGDLEGASPGERLAPPADVDGVVIYDPRQRNWPRVRSVGLKGEMPEPEKRALVARVFAGEQFVEDSSACDEREALLAPFVSQAATGSFTAPHVDETLYFFWNGECSASHAESWGTRSIAVFRGEALVAKMQLGATHLVSVFDLDGDGQDELVISGGFAGHGEVSSWAAVVRVERGELVELASFGEAYDANCAAGLEGAEETFLVIRAVRSPGTPLRFTTERVTQPCVGP